MILTALLVLLFQTTPQSHAGAPPKCVDPTSYLKLNRVDGNSQTIVYLDPNKRYSLTWKCFLSSLSSRQAKEQIEKLGTSVQVRPGLLEFTSRHGEILSSGFLVERARGIYDLYQFHRPVKTNLNELSAFKKRLIKGP